jgi:hypothetical protein
MFSRFRKLTPLSSVLEPHPWRPFLRFSVRGLLVLVLVAGAGMGWIVRDAHIQRDAVAAIKKAGGFVKYDWEWEWRTGKNISGGKPWAPVWLVNLIGVDYFGHVTVVGLPMFPSAADATFAEVGRLRQLQLLFARSSSVSDAGLAHLKELTNLKQLDLRDTQVSDAGLSHLTALRENSPFSASAALRSPTPGWRD